MTEEEIQHTVLDLKQRVEELEEEREKLRQLPEAVAELKGMVVTLSGMVTTRFDGIQPSVEKAASVKTAIQFASVVIVPILLALIGGYFALKSGTAK